MNGLAITCAQCGQRNPSHRVWCINCHTPVTSPLSPRDTAEDHAASDSVLLYGRILQDLRTLVGEEQVSSETHDVIKGFYEDRIALIGQQTKERERIRKLQGLVAAAREAAHDGRFKDALELIRRGPTEVRGTQQLEEMIAEIGEKNERRERELQKSREADALLHESNVSIAALRLDEAVDKLQQARRLSPNNKRIITALGRVKSQIANRQAQLDRERAEQAQLKEDQERHVVTALAEENEAQAEPDSSRGALQASSSFADDHEDIPSPRHRMIEAASQWSSIVKPFLLDNVGWFVGAFLVVAGFVILIVTFWGTIEQNRTLMHSLVYISLATATGVFFSAAYFIRLKYPQLESSSNILLVIVALLIPLVFAAALLTSLVPLAPAELALLQNPG